MVTGASGYIGHKLVQQLAAQGHKVHALVRSGAAGKLLQHPLVTLFVGDVLEKHTLLPALEGCQQVYHTAAKVGAWDQNPQVFYDVHVGGTQHVLEAAASAGVQRLVFTSTAGVLGPAEEAPVTEDHHRTLPFQIDYDRSKKEAEDLVKAYAANGLSAVIVSPAKVYGPGHTSHSLTANAIIRSFLRKGVAFIPAPGTYWVCFAYVDDVVQGHLQAMANGTSGETYLLGGNNVSYADFFGCIRQLSGSKGKIIALSQSVIKAAASAQEFAHRAVGTNIRFPVQSVDHLFSNYIFSSDKAVEHLGYHITPLEEALSSTIQFLKRNTHA